MNGITGFSVRKEKAGHKWLKGFLRHYPPAEAKKGKKYLSKQGYVCQPYYNWWVLYTISPSL